MTQEEKQLLLKDLCTRLPYGVKVCAMFNTGNRYTANVTAISADIDYIQIRQNDLHPYTGSSVEDIRPYLRPMSSMTDEEYEEYEKANDLDTDDSSETLKENMRAKSRVRISKWYHGVDWLNEHHFDFRGLIEKGLALEAPEDMYGKI